MEPRNDDLLMYAVARLIKEKGYEDNTMRVTEEEIREVSRKMRLQIWREEPNAWWVIRVVG